MILCCNEKVMTMVAATIFFHFLSVSHFVVIHGLMFFKQICSTCNNYFIFHIRKLRLREITQLAQGLKAREGWRQANGT